jgi:hypothetical protein
MKRALVWSLGLVWAALWMTCASGCDVASVPVHLRGEITWRDLATVEEGFSFWGLTWHEGKDDRGVVEIEFVAGYPTAGHSDTTGCDASIYVAHGLEAPELTLAHELGHALAGLQHREDDPDNVMFTHANGASDATDRQFDLMAQAARARRWCP